MNTVDPRFEACGFFVLRAPLLSVDRWAAWSDGQDLAALRAFVRAQVERAEVREAIAVASPSLLDGLPVWIRDPGSESGQKVERALVRYLSRMATRPTPFGLFAGCGLGTVGDRTDIRVAGIAGHSRRTRLDNDVLDRLGRRLTASPAIRPHLRLRPNSSLYEVAGRFRYVEPQHAEGGRTYDLVTVEGNEYVSACLARAKGGATALELVADLVERDPEVTPEEALAFVGSLIDSHVLVSELEPAVTGTEPIHGMIAELERALVAPEVVRTLADVERTLVRVDAELPFRPQAEQYVEVAQRIAALGEAIDPKRLFQVDMQLGLEHATLDRRVIDELVEAAALVARCCPEPEEQLLRRFAQDFEARYERREVPLLEALDEDCGIGFGKLRAEGNDPEAMLAGIHLPAPRGEAHGRTWGAFEEMLLHKLEAREPAAREIRLEPADLAGLPQRAVDLPDACALNVTFAAADADAMARGEYRALLHLVDGPSGANWLGRFCHADPALRRQVEESLRREEALRPDAVFAEIVHLPQGRLGNVLLRPTLRRYEIPYLGRSGAAQDHQILPEDLVVTVWDGRIVLKSKRLQREVIPRLSSAHAHSSPTNLGVYRFLGALQSGGRSPRTSWSWGALDARSTFLPRVTMGRVVLSLARWALKPRHLAPLDARTREGRWDAMQRLRASLLLPRRVCVADADNLLSVDLDNPLSVESAVQLLRTRPAANLVEMFPEPGEAWLQSPEGALTHEMIIPIARVAPAAARVTEPAPWLRPASSTPVQRLFLPGSRWLYVKLYASPRSCDAALLELAPLLRALVDRGDVRRWFFLRMGDTIGWHLRLRLESTAGEMPPEVLSQIRELVGPLLEDRRVWRMQVDTYHREVEHWGGPEGVQLGEDVLAIDSEAVLAILEAYGDDPAALAEARWQLALRGVDGLWRGLGLDTRARLDLALRCRAGFAREFGVGDRQEHQLSTRFRRVRANLERVLEAPSPWPAGELAMRRRDDALVPVFAQLRELERAGVLARPLLDLADRVSHLHVNRILRSMPREQEFVAVDLLARHYRSAIGRGKAKHGARSRDDAA